MIGADRRPNIRKKSSLFIYRVISLVYKCSKVRKFLTILYVRGGGEIVRYLGIGEGEGDGDRGIVISSGSVASDGIWGEDKGDNADEGEV